MQTASFTGFIRILFYILAFYYIFKFLAKLLLPLIVKKVVKAGENYQQQQERHKKLPGKGQSRDEIIYNDSNSKKQEKLKSRRLC
jgi:hypothetical protein